jgi:short subunit dehydrogenase-like uncharacterized protein
VSLALYGRNGQRLAEAAAGLTQDPRLVTGSLDDLSDRLAKNPPAVVISTVGPFASTAASVIDSLPAGTHYLDLSNEYASFEAVFARNDQAIRRGGQTLIPGAGFGVVSTESVLVTLCEDRPRPTHARVDALPSLAVDAGVIGEALAGSIVESLPSGRLQVRDGHLISAVFDDTPAELVTPDGEHLHSANFPSGDLLTAWRASQAPNVVAGSTEVPSGTVIRYALPVFSLLARSARLRRLATTRLANTTIKERPKPRPNSWGHATVKWSDGTEREGWLRVEDAMDFTCAVAAEVAQRLLRGEGLPGAHTPCALFGTGLAVAAGGEFVGIGSGA